MKYSSNRIVVTADLLGIALFAAEGALTAMRSGLDLLGVLIIAVISALGGGVIRDLLIGDTPPSAIADWRYPALAFFAGLMIFIFHSSAGYWFGTTTLVLDAAGLAVFAVAGTEKALNFRIKPFVAALLGTLTAVGGGMLRDMMLSKVPTIMVADIYATAALLGAATLCILRHFGWRASYAACAAGGVCFIVRILALWQHWELPKVSML